MAQARCRWRRQRTTGIGESVKDLLEGKPLRHPIHPMLVHFPIGFLVLSFLLDLVSLAFPGTPNLVRGSFYAMFLGIITALLAAVPGLVDYSDIRRDHPGKSTATRHMTLNLMVVAIYGINLWIRSSALNDPKLVCRRSFFPSSALVFYLYPVTWVAISFTTKESRSGVTSVTPRFR
jgi:uncharacterized membrane protein